MAQYILTASIIVHPDGNFEPDIPPVAEDTDDSDGLIYINGEGVRLGGFEGYVGIAIADIRAAIASGTTEGITADIYVHTSPEKMVLWNNFDWKGKKLKPKKLLSERAKAKKDELIDYEGNG